MAAPKAKQPKLSFFWHTSHTNGNAPESGLTSVNAPESGHTSGNVPDREPPLASVRKFQSSWLQRFPWLRFDKEKKTMWCAPCRKAGKRNTMALGVSSNFRTSTLTRHVGMTDHVCAIQVPKEQEYMNTATTKALNAQEKAIMTAMKAVFWMAKECIPLSKYSSLMNFLQAVEVPDIGQLKCSSAVSYCSYNTATDILDVLSCLIDENITQQIHQSPVIAVLCDESTDILVHHKLVISCRVVDPLTLAPKTFFLKDLYISDGTGKGIFTDIKKHLASRGVNIQQVTALGTDGASVMTGAKEGLFGQFLRVSPHMSSTHCSAHRIALCTEQAADSVKSVRDFARNVEDIFYHFKKSPQKVHQIQEVQKLLSDPVLKYREVHQIRWLSFMEALETVVRTLNSLLTYFSSKATKDPKCEGLKRRIGTEMFILLSHGLLDVLRPVICLSQFFQRKDLDIGCVKTQVDSCVTTLQMLKEGQNPLEKPTYLKMAQDELKMVDGKLMFKDHHVSKMTSRTQFSNVYQDYITAILKNIGKRFPDVELMTSFSVLALRPLSFLQKEEVATWGNNSIEYLLSHFGEEKTHVYQGSHTTSQPYVNKEATREEWIKLKEIVLQQQYPKHSMASLWTLIMQYHSQDFPNLSLLAAFALSHPIHTADCERSFSCQNQVTTPLRNRLSSEHCDMLMRVMIEGGSLEEFDFNLALAKWRVLKARKIFQKTQCH